jgi:hypothetical protein
VRTFALPGAAVPCVASVASTVKQHTWGWLVKAGGVGVGEGKRGARVAFHWQAGIDLCKQQAQATFLIGFWQST